ncbi:MAG TPA: GvpL/GvpF family gas vesicle protein [Polyangiaceae bacterium]
MRLYVYALVPPGTALGDLGTGVAGEPLALLPIGGLAAVVGEMEDRPSIAPGSLGVHDEILRRIEAAAGGFLPFPFGAMVDGEAELRDGVGPRAAHFLASIERGRLCDQMTVVVQADDPAAARARLREKLGTLVRAEKLDARASGPSRLTLFHLVPRASLDDYRARASALAAAIAPARVSLTGPWVPYAFTELG